MRARCSVPLGCIALLLSAVWGSAGASVQDFGGGGMHTA